MLFNSVVVSLTESRSTAGSRSVAAFSFRSSPVSGSVDQGQEIVPTVDPQGFRQPHCKRGK